MDKTIEQFDKHKDQLIKQNLWRLLLLAYLLLTNILLFGEGSVDFIDYDGFRLFYSANEQQQLKVYAKGGEYINVGASHIGLTGGYMNVYRPDGSLHTTFDNTGQTAGLAIIYNDVEEKNGPTGGGITMGGGYIPGVISVDEGEEGIWTVTMEFPEPTILVFSNLLNSATWTRENDQPTIQRGVLAWDISVSQGEAGNQGGTFLSGRVFSNEYISVVSNNGNVTSPTYNVLGKDGFIYKVNFMETDPWNFPWFSTSLGILTGDGMPAYRSLSIQDIVRTTNPNNWSSDQFYILEPQTEDQGVQINNKIFFNIPNTDLPSEAITTDIFRSNTYTTWLYNPPAELDLTIHNFTFTGKNAANPPLCPPDMTEQNGVAYIAFNSTVSGVAILHLDLNSDGDYEDNIDRDIYQYIESGGDTIRWDGIDGLGNVLLLADGYTLSYELEIRGGEMHVLMSDIENNLGGITFELLNPPTNLPYENSFYYDHSAIGETSDVSGGGMPGNPLSTTIPFTYMDNYGNEKMLDYWTFIEYGGQGVGTFNMDLFSSCGNDIDNDNDGINDRIDLDDDNDGVPDKLEFCINLGGFNCLPNTLDPSGDEDEDGIANFQDADDAALSLECNDNNGDGICDQVLFQYDLDGDNIPNHLDLDSDNDGITDLVEAGHDQIDANSNGTLDGVSADFGLNGFFNALASDADALDAVANYTPWDKDADAVPDYHDLDSDNDGINDVTEAGFGGQDTNNDGRLPLSNSIALAGLSIVIAPIATGQPIPLPVDTDLDLILDYHDLDSDNDGINDVIEAGKPDDDNDGIIGTGIPEINSNGHAMEDGNSIPLFITSFPTSTDGDNIPDYLDLDSDADGISDVVEAGHTDPDNDNIVGIGMPIVNENGQVTGNYTPTSNPTDTDNDGQFDFQELDSDQDGILDEFECPNDAPCADSDNDGLFDFQDVDRDNDGIEDIYECESGVPCVDTDNDGIPDVDDLDSDNDGLSDAEECPNGFPCPDSDGDNIDDFRDYNCNELNTPQIANLTGEGSYCAGEDIVISAMNANPAIEEVIFRWEGPNGFLFAGTATAEELFSITLFGATMEEEGTYILTLEAEECFSNPQSIFINISGQPTTPILNTNDDVLCAGENIELNTTSYTGDVSYDWYFTEENGSTATLIETTAAPSLIISAPNATNSGTYAVIVTVDACSSNISNIEQVTILGIGTAIDVSNSTSLESPACIGETISFTANPLIEGTSYEWIGPNSFTSDLPNPSLSDISLEDAGEYVVFVSQNGCPAIASAPTVVYVQENMTPIIGGGGTLCTGESVHIEVTNDLNITVGSTVSYHWFEAATNTIVETTTEPNLTLNNISTEQAGEYYLNVSINGCVSQNSNIISIQLVEQPAEQAIIIEETLDICGDQELLIEAIANTAAVGTWTTTSSATIVSPNDAQTIIFGLNEGQNVFIWTLSTVACGDYSSDTLRVILEEDFVDAAIDTITINYETTLERYNLLENDGLIGQVDEYVFSIIEQPAQGELIIEESGVITYIPEMKFSGIVEFIYEICSMECPESCAQARVEITVNKAQFSGECFIPNTFTPNEDGMNDAFSIDCLETTHLNNQVMVFNRWGDKVFEKENYRNDWEGTYNGQDLPPGTYFYIIKLDKTQDEALQGYMSLLR